jgi:hypothetical protein
MQRALVGAAAFGALHSVASRVLPALLGQKRMAAVQRSKNRQHPLYFAEMIGSSAHAAFVGISALWVLIRQRRQHGFDVDVFKPYPKWFDVVFSTSAGWSIWDMVAMYGAGEHPAMWLHHIIVLTGSVLMQCYRQAAFFPAIFGITELTVLPHNAMWYLSALGLQATHARLEARLSLARALFMLVFRLPIGPASIAYAVKVHGGAKFWQQYRQLPITVQTATAFNILALSVMNCIWTGGAVSVARKHFRRLVA